MKSHATPGQQELNNLLLSPSHASPASAATPSPSALENTRKLLFVAAHNMTHPLVTNALGKIKHIPHVIIPHLFDTKGELHNSGKMARTRIREELVRAFELASQSFTIDEVIIMTDFNIGYSGKDLVSSVALQRETNERTSLAKQLVGVANLAEYNEAKQQQKIPVKFFVQGGGGHTTIETLDALRNGPNGDPAILPEITGFSEAIRTHNFNKMPALNKYLLFLGVPNTPSTASKSTPVSQSASVTSGSSSVQTESPAMNFPSVSPPTSAFLGVPALRLPEALAQEVASPKTPIDKKIAQFKLASPTKGAAPQQDEPAPHHSPTILIDHAPSMIRSLSSAEVDFPEQDPLRLPESFMLHPDVSLARHTRRKAKQAELLAAHSLEIEEATFELRMIDFHSATPPSPLSLATSPLESVDGNDLSGSISSLIGPQNSPLSLNKLAGAVNQFGIFRMQSPEGNEEDATNTPAESSLQLK